MNTDGSPRPARRTAGGDWNGELRIDGWMFDQRLEPAPVPRQSASRRAFELGRAFKRGLDAGLESAGLRLRIGPLDPGEVDAEVAGHRLNYRGLDGMGALHMLQYLRSRRYGRLHTRLQHHGDGTFVPVRHDVQVLRLSEQARQLQSMKGLADEKDVASKQKIFARLRRIDPRNVCGTRVAFMSRHFQCYRLHSKVRHLAWVQHCRRAPARRV